MNAQEFVEWIRYGMTRANLWTVDQIHNGCGSNNFLAYRSSPEDPSLGIYVRADNDGKLYSGRYQDGYPHIGEAIFYIKVQKQFASKKVAIKYAIERLGMKFLLDLMK